MKGLIRSALLALVVASACSDSTKPPALTSIEVTSDEDGSLMLGESLQLNAEGKDDKGNPFDVSTFEWKSSNTAVATVNASGLVTAVGGGTAVISAAVGTIQGVFTVTVSGSLHNADVTTSQTWRAVDNPHLVTAQIEVHGAGSPELTIEPGADIRFAPGTGLWIGAAASGSIMANGTAAAPIVMRADASSPTKGHWAGVYFIRTAGPSELHHVHMTHCGSGAGNESACLSMGDANAPSQVPKVLVDNVTIENSGGFGAFAKGGAGFRSGSTTLTITGSTKAPIHITANEIGDIPAGGTFSGNTPNVVEIRDSRVTTTQTWPALGIPYVALQDVIVEATDGPVLTLPAGTEVRLELGRSFTIGTCGAGGPGTLLAEGTATAPITFTANATSPTAGSWGQLYIACSASANTRLTHAVVEYGGGTSPYAAFAANVMVEEDIGPFITNTVIRFSKDCGVVRRSPLVTWTTDFTAPAHNNTFANNARTQCGP